MYMCMYMCLFMCLFTYRYVSILCFVHSDFRGATVGNKSAPHQHWIYCHCFPCNTFCLFDILIFVGFIVNFSTNEYFGKKCPMCLHSNRAILVPGISATTQDRDSPKMGSLNLRLLKAWHCVDVPLLYGIRSTPSDEYHLGSTCLPSVARNLQHLGEHFKLDRINENLEVSQNREHPWKWLTNYY